MCNYNDVFVCVYFIFQIQFETFLTNVFMKFFFVIISLIDPMPFEANHAIVFWDAYRIFHITAHTLIIRKKPPHCLFKKHRDTCYNWNFDLVF